MIMMQSLHQISLHSIMMQSFSHLKVASEAGVNCTPMPPLCPTGGDAPPPPCERKHSVTPNVFSVTPSSCWVGYGWLVGRIKDPNLASNGNQ